MKLRKRIAAIAAASLLALAVSVPSFAAESAMDTLCAPSGITAMPDGSFLVTDTYNKVVWRVEGRTSTVYGGVATVGDLYGQPVGGYNDSALNDSYFKEPWAIAPFLDGYAVSDAANNVVRFIAYDKNKVQTATGQRAKGSANGYGIGATFSRPTGLATDEDGNLYIADTGNNRIRKLTKTGTITTYLENLNEPTGLCWKNGILYICESGANRILKAENGSVSVLAGTGGETLTDGSVDQAQFHDPQGITVADDGIIYVSDTGNNAVRKIQGGMVSTLAVCDQNSMDPSPIAPVGLMVKDDQLYVCDNFSRAVLTYPR